MRPASILRLRPLTLLFAFFLLLPNLSRAAAIASYAVISREVVDQSGRKLWAIRSFLSDGAPHLLAVDPATLRSYDLPARGVKNLGSEGELAKTPYGKSLDRFTAPPYRLQNHGAIRAERGYGVYLTVDLCPSRRPFERELFDSVAALGKGTPVAVAVSGTWIKTHPSEFAYLKKTSDSGALDITWINHSLDHPYDSKLPLSDNFLLSAGTDFDREVLGLEQILLSHGVTPSPFFRFPGLVADGATLKRLRELSLIPIGSDAWLAKGEKAREGSFILVHGNGNEAKGVQLLLPLLRGLKLRALAEAFTGGPR